MNLTDSQRTNEEKKAHEWGFQFWPAAESPLALSLNVPLLLTLIPCCLFLPFSVALWSFLCHRDVSCHRCYRSTVERCDYPRRCFSNRLAHSLALRRDVSVVTLSSSQIKRQFHPHSTFTHHGKYSGLNKKNQVRGNFPCLNPGLWDYNLNRHNLIVNNMLIWSSHDKPFILCPEALWPLTPSLPPCHTSPTQRWLLPLAEMYSMLRSAPRGTMK